MVNKELQYVQHSESHLCGQVCLNICRTQGVPVLNTTIWKQNQTYEQLKSVSLYLSQSKCVCVFPRVTCLHHLQQLGVGESILAPDDGHGLGASVPMTFPSR